MSRAFLVTGAGSGIGRAAALALAEHHRLFLLDRDEEGLARTAAACGLACVGKAIANVSDADAVDTALGHALPNEEALDGLINAAGVGRHRPFSEIEAEDWAMHLGVNLVGTANVIRSALPHLLRRERALVINVGSQRGTNPKPGTAAYSAGKAGLLALTQTLDLEYREQGLRFSYLAPGGTQTALATPKAAGFMVPETVGATIRFMVDIFPEGWVRDLTLLPSGTDV